MKRTILVILVFAGACGRGPTAPTEIPLYNRAEWDHWIDTNGDCQDTRQEVLIEESLIAVTLDAQGCRVIVGMWRDEYTGAIYNDPGDLDVDHRVPLANAWVELGRFAKARVRERSDRSRTPGCRECECEP
jgi:hypothetical protein